MRTLLAKFESLTAETVSVEEPVTSAEDMNAALCDLRAFYEEWTDIARVVVTRRDYLIRLGLAHRKSPAAPEEPTDPSGGAGAPH